MKRLAILASGNGSNAEQIIKYFNNSKKATVCLIASNNSEAFVLKRAKSFGIPSFTFNRKELEGGRLLQKLKKEKIDWIILAGFLLKIPKEIISAYSDRIINIHPSLLPKYGGKGMYGIKVHEAVKEAGDEVTGITIHLVNERYDEGKIIFQAATKIEPSDTPEKIATKVHSLEHRYFPEVIESLI